jgi:hypothetical protein
VRSTRPQQSRSVCSGNPVLCARKYGFVGRFGRCEQLLVATRSSFSKGAFQMTFAGSIPPCPATQCGLHYAISGFGRTADIPAG